MFLGPLIILPQLIRFFITDWILFVILEAKIKYKRLRREVTCLADELVNDVNCYKKKEEYFLRDLEIKYFYCWILLVHGIILGNLPFTFLFLVN